MIGWFVGIDQSFSGFAVAFYRPDLPYDKFVHRRAFPAAKLGSGVDRLVKVNWWLKNLFEYGPCSKTDVIHVAMEGYSRASKHRREEAGELSATVRRTLWETLPYPARYPTIVAPTQVKMFATGKGNADKANVIKGVHEKWGLKFTDDNEADAYTLARIAHSVHRGRADLPYEQSILDKLIPNTEAPKAA